MPGLWKAWKAKSRLPTLSTSPLGNPAKGQARFPHFHSAGDEGDGKVENQKQVSHFPTAPNLLSQNRKKTAAGFAPRPPSARPSGTDFSEARSTKGDIAQQPHFRLTPHWNRSAVSGSSPIGINSGFQAHLWIGKCFGATSAPSA
jgi:hypothetical protein